MEDLKLENMEQEYFNCKDILSKYKCKYCDFMTDLWITLCDHISNDHRSLASDRKTISTIKVYLCKDCDFKSYSLLVGIEHEGKCKSVLDAYQIEIKNFDIGYRFKTMSFFSDSEKNYRCGLCGFKSNSRDVLHSHFLRRHTDTKYRQCNQCSFKTTDGYVLKNHVIRKHTNVDKIKWLKCEYCSYKAKINENLYRHTRSRHTQALRECSKTAEEYDLLRHVKKHTDSQDIRWFECHQCDYKAKHSANLRIHINLKHATKYQSCHECRQCSFKTLRKWNLRNHMILHHAEPEEIKWFQCHQCNYKAKLKQYLAMHVKTRHT